MVMQDLALHFPFAQLRCSQIQPAPKVLTRQSLSGREARSKEVSSSRSWDAGQWLKSCQGSYHFEATLNLTPK